MKNFKFGIIELLGCIAILLWASTILLRNINLSNHPIYLFFLGSSPNLCAAWVTTMFGKWMILISKQNYTFKIHQLLCFGIVVMALLSEIVYDLFFNSRFDLIDFFVTIIAQLIIFLLPLLIHKEELFNQH